MDIGRQRHAPGTDEKVIIQVNGLEFDITFTELYTVLGLRTATEQNEFRREFVGANMGKPPGVLLGKLRRRRPDMVALLETISVR